ncbi:macro domain-containing protein [Lentzea sp. NPDC051838]|uniref:macro domain-containing protein n=1 Tax=Lentzea sp. NPDC051838 TaxID=3154849 RepID=UPI00342F15DD
MGTIEVVRGDITAEHVDAIVTAANESLLGGGGVDGAIHRAAGPRLAEAGSALAPCEPGKAVATPAFDLAPVKHVIHTVGPVWEGGDQGEDDVLISCYIESLLLAEELELESIAFPAIATGIYGFPTERAADLAAITIRSLPIIERIRFVAFDHATNDALTKALAEPVVELCPTCGEKGVPIIYGCMIGDLGLAWKAGLVRLGFSEDGTRPQWECPHEHEWGTAARDQRRSQVAIQDAITAVTGEDRGWSVP